MTRRVVTVAAVMGVLLGTCTVCGGGELLVAGDAQALWLVRSSDEGRFDLVARPTGGTWKWVSQDLSGKPVAAVADKGALHLAFTSGQYHVFSQHSPQGTPGLSLPAEPVAMCAAEAIGPSGAGGLVALVPAPTAATTKPREDASQPVGESIFEVLLNAQGQWKSLATLTDLPDEAAKTIHMTAWRSALYVLVAGNEKEGNRLSAWDGATWEDIKLPPPLTGSDVVSLTEVADRLVVVTKSPAEQGKVVGLEMATRSTPDGEFVLQPITAEGKRAWWSSSDRLAVTVLADRLALLWQSEEALKLATCSPITGQLDPIEDVRIFEQPDVSERGQQIVDFFLWGLLILILVPMFVLRPGGAPKPFSLPEGMVPASLGRRFLAGVVDLLPFLVISDIYLQAVLPMSPEARIALYMELLRGRGALPVELAYAGVGTVVLYLAYSVVMEMYCRATIGKLLLKLRVVGDEAKRPKALEVLLRNLVKIVEVFFFPPLLLAMAVTRYRQRLGDIAARTTVIDTRLVVPPASPPRQEPEHRPEQRDDSPPPPPAH